MEHIIVDPICLDLATAAGVLSLSESTFQALTRDDPTFPKARRFSVRRVGWLYGELIAWAETRPVSDILPPKNTGSKKPRAKLSPTSADDASRISSDAKTMLYLRQEERLAKQ